MAIRTGVDLVYIPRFSKEFEAREAFGARLFTEKELEDPGLEHLAGIFAAKEAVLKAIGFKPDVWKEVQIEKRESGEPFVTFLSPIGDHVEDIHISISHEKDYAMAVAVATITHKEA